METKIVFKTKIKKKKTRPEMVGKDSGRQCQFYSRRGNSPAFKWFPRLAAPTPLLPASKIAASALVHTLLDIQTDINTSHSLSFSLTRVQYISKYLIHVYILIINLL